MKKWFLHHKQEIITKNNVYLREIGELFRIKNN